MVVYRNTSHVRCQCQRLGTFGVLMDSSQREVSGLSQSCPTTSKIQSEPCFYFFFSVLSLREQQLEGDLETLALVTYSTLCLSMLALLLTVLVLSCLRGLKSNTRSIHSNTAAAMFLSELVFLLGINQTEQQVACAFVRPSRVFPASFSQLLLRLNVYTLCVEICARSDEIQFNESKPCPLTAACTWNG